MLNNLRNKQSGPASPKTSQGGLIKLIVIIIIIIIILSYFGFDIENIVESPETQGNLGYVWGLLVNVWEDYLAGPVLYLWNDIFIDLLWDAFVSNIERIRDGQPTDFDLNAPTVPSAATTTP